MLILLPSQQQRKRAAFGRFEFARRGCVHPEHQAISGINSAETHEGSKNPKANRGLSAQAME
jgi:hypothetical protein